MMSFVDCIYTTELEIKDTTDTDMSTSYLDLHFEPDSGMRGWEGAINNKQILRQKKLFQFFHFPFICSNNPAQPAYMEYVYLI